VIGQLIEIGCRATPGLSRWYLDHYVSIKRLEKQVRRRVGFPTPPSSVDLLLTYACNFTCAIMPTGDVIGAAVLHDAAYSEGNIKNQRLREIWHSGFQRYRKPFLRGNGCGIELRAFPEKIDATDQAVSFFPELCATPIALVSGYRKKQFCPEAIYPGSTADAVRPDLILFPKISGKSASRVERLSKAKALEAILLHSLLVFDRAISVDHFQLLARLITGTDSYRLALGRDILDLPALVDSLLG
jgi:hypothetical protein